MPTGFWRKQLSIFSRDERVHAAAATRLKLCMLEMNLSGSVSRLPSFHDDLSMWEGRRDISRVLCTGCFIKHKENFCIFAFCFLLMYYNNWN
jgi:hypothetical protein